MNWYILEDSKDTLDEPLFWMHDFGFADFGSATPYSDAEAGFPIFGTWVTENVARRLSDLWLHANNLEGQLDEAVFRGG